MRYSFPPACGLRWSGGLVLRGASGLAERPCRVSCRKDNALASVVGERTGKGDCNKKMLEIVTFCPHTVQTLTFFFPGGGPIAYILYMSFGKEKKEKKRKAEFHTVLLKHMTPWRPRLISLVCHQQVIFSHRLHPSPVTHRHSLAHQ